MNSKQARNSLTIEETKDILCAEHAGRIFASRLWWSIIPNREDSFAQSGDASNFWQLVYANRELGQPLAFTKVLNKLGRLVNVPVSDPEQALRTIIKPEVKAPKPIMEIIEARCELSGHNPKDVYREREAEYNAEVKAAEAQVNLVIKQILAQEPVMDDNGERASSTMFGDFNPDTGEYEVVDVLPDEVLIPIDYIIEFAEKQLKYMATNRKVSDLLFGTEKALWDGEITLLKQIVQEVEHEGAAPDYVAAMDDKLLDAAGIAAGMSSGK